MRYPEFLKKNSTIGLIAPSFGVSGFPYEDRFESALKKMKKLGYRFKQVEHLYGIEKGRSADGKTRAEEFMQLYTDPEVDFIWSVAGGELELEIIPYLNFELLKSSKPKYIIGFSDNTCLTFLMNTVCDTASIYGINFGTMGMYRYDQSVKECYSIICGELLKQNSYDRYERPVHSSRPRSALSGYHKNTPVEYKTINYTKPLQGRLVGGCLDVLDYFLGTPYDHFAEFKEKYKNDGVLLFFEACDLSPIGVKRALWKLKENGWFENVSGLLIGRPGNPAPFFGVTYDEALEESLKELNIPVIYNMDFGHVPPSFTLLSGAIATVECKDGKGTITYKLD